MGAQRIPWTGLRFLLKPVPWFVIRRARVCEQKMQNMQNGLPSSLLLSPLLPFLFPPPPARILPSRSPPASTSCLRARGPQSSTPGSRGGWQAGGEGRPGQGRGGHVNMSGGAAGSPELPATPSAPHRDTWVPLSCPSGPTAMWLIRCVTAESSGWFPSPKCPVQGSQAQPSLTCAVVWIRAGSFA